MRGVHVGQKLILLILGESEALLGVWWGRRGSSGNEGGPRSSSGGLRRLFGGATFVLPAEWKKLFEKKSFFVGLCV